MNQKSKRKGNKLDALTEEWYRKLKDSGFTDIELDVSKEGLYRRDSPRSLSAGPALEWDGELNQYNGAADWVHLLQDYIHRGPELLTNVERSVLEDYSNGYTQAEIVRRHLLESVSLYRVSKTIKKAMTAIQQEAAHGRP